MHKPYTIDYEFHFANGPVKRFRIALDPLTLSIIPAGQRSKPEWTRLEVQQCRCCTLNAQQTSHCPIAVNIAEMVETCKTMKSTHSCGVHCITAERTYSKNTSVQDGLFSIFGLIMATSDCPGMALFKPMARFHLPFATVEETLLRFLTFYFLRQYYEHTAGRIPTFDLAGMQAHYNRVQQINDGILARIRQIAVRDADANAIIILNALTQMVTMEAGEKFNSLQYLFRDS